MFWALKAILSGLKQLYNARNAWIQANKLFFFSFNLNQSKHIFKEQVQRVLASWKIGESHIVSLIPLLWKVFFNYQFNFIHFIKNQRAFSLLNSSCSSLNVFLIIAFFDNIFQDFIFLDLFQFEIRGISTVWQD